MRISFKLVTAAIIALAYLSALNSRAATKSVTVSNFAFTPATTTVNVGDTVSWRWTSGTHSVTSLDDLFNSGDLPASSTFSFQFTAPGDYFYFCDLHGSMQASVTVSQPANVPPSVGISSPAANALFLYSPTNIAVQATASDSDGTVTSVEFLLDNVSKATLTAPPYNTSLSSVAAGVHTIKVVATDNAGAQTSSTISITVNNPPTASITAPANSSVVVTTSNVTLTATGSDADGTLSQLQIYVNNVLFGSSTTSPFSKTFVPATNGVYTIKAVSTDNRGAVITSAPVQLTGTVLNFSSFKILNNKFQFNISGLVAPKSFVLQGASLLSDSITWTGLQTNTASSDTFTFSDPDSSSLNLRYYRVIELP
jgi:plastocyanin